MYVPEIIYRFSPFVEEWPTVHYSKAESLVLHLSFQLLGNLTKLPQMLFALIMVNSVRASFGTDFEVLRRQLQEQPHIFSWVRQNPTFSIKYFSLPYLNRFNKVPDWNVECVIFLLRNQEYNYSLCKHALLSSSEHTL
jgi:hypothetical protein